ncbi:MAG: coniferyl-aldehyde dehydrogenase [Deltaproteobacteria bacterium]|nr:coniferyl-aldehyde dehydrogenase [Deltaproteobacteria bacterium]
MTTKKSSAHEEESQNPENIQESPAEFDNSGAQDNSVPSVPESEVDRADQMLNIFQNLKKIHVSEGEIPKKKRKVLLKKLKKLLIVKRQEVIEVVSKDFRGRSSYETLAAEVLLTCNTIRHTLRHLDEWMEIQDREVDLTFWPAKTYLKPQALGVVGIISPWNYPISLALIPVVQAISAGNRVMVKPSEFTPHSSKFLKDILKEAIGDDYVRVVCGGVEVGVEFSKIPFHHLFFTGAPEIGKKIMAAASENLTPVTLELGGKSPALIHSSFSISTAASRIASGKFLNAGQTCIAPDYVLCPKDKVSEFVEAIKKHLEKMYPSLKDNDDYTSIIHDRHRNRLLDLVSDAQEKGANVHIHNPKNEDLSNKVAPHVLDNLDLESRIMKEEIFGPILPIIPYSSIEEAISFIQDRPRPLALYYFDNNKKRIRGVLSQTHAGGVCINDTLLQVSQDNLPFGGIGNSGMGAYHGKEGFDTFIHHKPVFHQSRLSLVPMLTRPPYPKWVRSLVRFLIGW